MRKSIALVAAVILALAITGCGKSEKTYTSKDGSVTVETSKNGEKQEVVVKTEDGEATYTVEEGKKVTEAEVGVPIYPGAKPGATGKIEDSSIPGQPENYENYNFTTKDSFEKVTEFYQSKLKDVNSSFSNTQGDSKTAIYQMGTEEKPVVVNVISNKGEDTVITITKMQEQK